MSDVLPESEIKVGMRVLVIVPPDEHCRHEILFGVGVVTFTAERTEVEFDDGNGGMFPNRFIRREPQTWAEVAERLRSAGWEVKYLPVLDDPPYLWRGPDGLSGSEYRSHHPDSPPEAVMRHAYRLGNIHFTHLADRAVTN